MSTEREYPNNSPQFYHGNDPQMTDHCQAAAESGYDFVKRQMQRERFAVEPDDSRIPPEIERARQRLTSLDKENGERITTLELQIEAMQKRLRKLKRKADYIREAQQYLNTLESQFRYGMEPEKYNFCEHIK